MPESVLDDEATAAIAAYWDGQAAVFDDEPDHGLADAATRAGWRDRFAGWLPPPPALVADLGCGTGSIAVLLATMGYDVTASDIAPAMVARARDKARAAGTRVEVTVADAARPRLRPGSVDVVVVRHLAWTLPDPSTAIDRWATLLRPGGRLIMVEGRWATGDQGTVSDGDDDAGGYGGTVGDALPWFGGIGAATLVPVLQRSFAQVEHHDLSDDATLWGREVSDERYAVVARRP